MASTVTSSRKRIRNREQQPENAHDRTRERLTPGADPEHIEAFEDKDTEVAPELWAEDGLFIDPHYPEPESRGPDEIRRALEWALENIVAQPRLTVRRVWEDGDDFAVEVDTNHTLRDGTEIDFPQVFIVECRDGQIARWQSYLPFPPPGDE